jgi:hypothetical protein
VRRSAVVLAFTCVLLAAGSAHAQRVLDLQRFSPAPDGDGFLTIPGTRTPGPFNTNFGLYGNYGSNLLMLRNALDGTTRPVVSDRVDLDAFFQVGILGRFALVLDAPVIAYQQGNGPFYDGGPGIPVVAIRDPRLAARVRLVGEDSTTDRARHEGEGIGLLVATTLPLGMTDAFAGEGAPVIEGALLGDFHLLDFGIGGQLGFRHHFAEPSILGVSFRNQLYGSIGVQVPAFFLDHVWAIAEVDVTTDAENPFGSNASTAVEWRLGGRGSIGDAQITVAGGSGLVNGIGAPSGRLIVGVTFAPRVHDRDGDHITDDHDACQTLPEDFDQHEDDDGCPEPDNDGDLVPDLDDHCPNDAADFEHDADEDGCTDPLVDTDGDGRTDDVDACPAEAEDADGFQDDDGCPDPDDDGDGVPDASDGCPREAEDADDHDDADGCPDLDDDGDGVPDASDACPRAAEDADGHDDADGCPDPDDDHDGVLDANDRCPTELETINGVTDDDGCPDAGRGRLRTEGTRGSDDFRVTGALRFAADGSLPASQAPVLDELAAWLRADPQLTHVSVGVRTWLPAYETALVAALAARGVTQTIVVGNWDSSLRAPRFVARHAQVLHLQAIDVQPVVPAVTRALVPALSPAAETLVQVTTDGPAATTTPAPSGGAATGTLSPEAP